MPVNVRFDGDPADIDRLLARLADVVEVAGGDRDYQNRRGFGVRRYVEMRPCPAPTVTERRR